MTVSTDINRVDYNGNGSAVDFAVPFRFLDNSHVKVILTDAAGIETTQVESTDYTLVGVGDDAGGTVTMIIAPASEETLTIIRDVPITQETDYVENDPFPAEAHEDALDKSTMIAQQQQEQLDRILQFTEGSQDTIGLTMDSPESQKLIRWRSDLSGTENVALVDISQVTLTDADLIRRLETSDGILTTDLTGIISIATDGKSTKGDTKGLRFVFSGATILGNAGTIVNNKYYDLVGNEFVVSQGVSGDFYTDSGVADAYVLTAVGITVPPDAYQDGMRISFIPDSDGTGGVTTVNVNALGIKNIKFSSGGNPDDGDISGRAEAVFDEGNDWFELQANETILKSSISNLLIGNFRVNQREVSGSVVLSAGEYGHDRFRAGSGGCTYTFATSSGVTTATISAGTLEQEVEGVNIITGVHVFSWTGTAQGRIDGGSFSSTGVTASLIGGTNSIVEFDTGTISSPQLEKGSLSTRFQNRKISDELSLCRWYAREIVDNSIASTHIQNLQCTSATAGSGALRFEEMRSIPVVSFSAASDFDITGGAGNAITITALASFAESAKSIRLGFTGGSGLNAGNSTQLRSKTTNASIFLDSEL